MSNTWRESARPIIAQVIYENKHLEVGAIRKKLRYAYPWGVRKYWPYKVWLDECKRQLILNRIIENVPEKDPRQLDLFNDGLA